MNYFNYLPIELIENIFKRLNFDNLINLRNVDKKFKLICEQIEINQLYLTDDDQLYIHNDFNYHGQLHEFWFYTMDPTFRNKVNLIEISKFLNYRSIFELANCLKRLYLSIIKKFDFSILNEFKLLEQIYISGYSLYRNHDENNCKLSLNNLKILEISIVKYNRLKLTLDTNKLFALKVLNSNELENIDINYPDKITYFETINLIDVSMIRSFNNLQHLKYSFKYLCSYNRIDRNILSKLNNLKILDLNLNLNSSYSIREINLFNNLIEETKFLIDEKENLKRSDLNIYLNGVKLIDQNQLNKLKWSSNLEELNNNLLEFQMKNFDLLEDNCENIYMNYCHLNKINELKLSSFIKKFPMINHIYALHIDNECRFLKFLNDLSCLYKLELINCGLTKSFYDKLIDLVYLNDLKYLIIDEKEDLEINFDFILNLKQLEAFDTNQKINNHIDLIYRLFKENRYAYYFEFKFDTKNYIRINYENDDCYDGDERNESEITVFNLDDNLKEVKNFSINSSKNLEDIILIKLKNINSFLVNS